MRYRFVAAVAIGVLAVAGAFAPAQAGIEVPGVASGSPPPVCDPGLCTWSSVPGYGTPDTSGAVSTTGLVFLATPTGAVMINDTEGYCGSGALSSRCDAQWLVTVPPSDLTGIAGSVTVTLSARLSRQVTGLSAGTSGLDWDAGDCTGHYAWSGVQSSLSFNSSATCSADQLAGGIRFTVSDSAPASGSLRLDFQLDQITASWAP